MLPQFEVFPLNNKPLRGRVSLTEHWMGLVAPKDPTPTVTLTTSAYSPLSLFIGQLNKGNFSCQETESMHTACPVHAPASRAARVGGRAAMSLQSTTTASWSPLNASSAVSQIIWTWVTRVSGCWAPSQMSLMYRDTRKAAAAEEGDNRAVRAPLHAAGKQVIPPTHRGTRSFATCLRELGRIHVVTRGEQVEKTN